MVSFVWAAEPQPTRLAGNSVNRKLEKLDFEKQGPLGGSGVVVPSGLGVVGIVSDLLFENDTQLFQLTRGEPYLLTRFSTSIRPSPK